MYPKGLDIQWLTDIKSNILLEFFTFEKVHLLRIQV